MNINEGAGIFRGMPKHWISWLMKSGWMHKMVGEHSELTPLGHFSGKLIKRTLKINWGDKYPTKGIIGKHNNEFIFMIVPHEGYTTKFRFFETTVGGGAYSARGYSTRVARKRTYQDAYTIEQIESILNSMESIPGINDIEIFKIEPDKNRIDIVTKRAKISSVVDPLASTSWDNDNIAMANRSKKYIDIKHKKLDKDIEIEKESIKNDIISNLDLIMDNLIKDVKKGYSHPGPNTIGQELVKVVDFKKLIFLAKQYSALSTYKNPYRNYNDLKNVRNGTR